MSLACSNCKGTEILTDYREGIQVCTGCGQVHSSIIFDELGELQTKCEDTEAYGDTRLGPAIDPADSSELLGTTIGIDFAHSNLHQWSLRTLGTQKTARLNETYEELTSIFRNSRIPEKLIGPVKRLYKQATTMKQTSGRAKTCTLIGCIDLASKLEAVPVDIEKTAKSLNIDIRDVKKAKYTLEASLFRLTGRELIRNRVKFVCARLKMSRKLKRTALHVCSKAEEIGLVDAPESVVAAAAVFLVSRYSRAFESVKLAEVAAVLAIKTITVKSFFAKIKSKRFEVLVPKIPVEILKYKVNI